MIESTWKPLFSPPPAARQAWDAEVNCAIATGAGLWIIINSARVLTEEYIVSS